MTVPYTFANQSGTILLEELDANFTAVVAHVDTAGTVTENAQPNITAIGTLSSLTVTGNVFFNNFATGNIASGNISAAGNITGNNLYINSIVNPVSTNDLVVTGQIFVDWLDESGNALPGTGIVANTDNIYDIGSDSSAFANGYFNGTVTAATFSAMGNITGNYFIGNGSQLTGISASNIVGSYANSNVAAYLPTYSGNIQAGNITVSGIVSAGGNVRGSNLNTAGVVSAAGNVYSNGNIAMVSNLPRNTWVSNVAPTGGQGNIGDIWFQY